MKSFLALGILLGVALLEAQDPDRVVVVANKFDPDSMRIARYYMEKRNIPDENLIAWRMTDERAVDWQTFVEEIYNPLKEKLIEGGWLNAIPGTGLDPYGRRQDLVLSHKIDYLVLCRGIPLMVTPDVSQLPSQDAVTAKLVFEQTSNRKYTSFEAINHHFRSAIASVDAELSLIPDSNMTPVQVFYPNTLYRKLEPSSVDLNKVIRIARLDGPTVNDVRGMIDSANAGEKYVLRGRAYNDAGGTHKVGNQWLDSVAEKVHELGYDLYHDKAGALFKEDIRFDAPAIYFGWHAYNIEGPFTLEDFRFPPGAIAFHLFSFSAKNMRTADSNWTAPFVARGVAATIGNVHEPMLELTHHLNMLMEALSLGKTFGEAAYYSFPALSWMAVTVGDPLYRPFMKSLPEQLTIEDTSSYAQYTVIRQMNLLLRDEKKKDAIEVGINGYRKSPGLALALKLSKLYMSEGMKSKAISLLAPLTELEFFRAEDIPVALEIAQVLNESDESAMAYTLCSSLLDHKITSDALRKKALGVGIPIAEKAKELRVMMNWNQRLRDLE